MKEIEEGRNRFVKAYDIFNAASRGIAPFIDEGFQAVQR